MGTNYLDDTIAALSTPYGEGGIAIVRISGPDALEAASRLYESPSGRRGAKFAHHKALYGRAVDPEDGSYIDEAIFLPMLSPRSYTTEDVVEIQCHGGMTCVAGILGALFRTGVRQALPGEFTRRAFLGGRIDLIQAEAVMDVIEAKSDESLSMAMEQLEGKYSRELEDFKKRIVEAAALIEAPIDYPDEDLYLEDSKEAMDRLMTLRMEARRMLELSSGGRLYREGARASLIGKPNTGKSSVLNMLLGEDRAIVSDTAGTTRDTVEDYCVMEGIAIRLCDTAGIRDAECSVERLGIERTREAAAGSDLVIAVLDSSSEASEEDLAVLSLASAGGRPFIALLNKSDLPPKFPEEEVLKGRNCRAVRVSAKTGEGRRELEEAIASRLKGMFRASSTSRFIASQRHREALSQIESNLGEAVEAAAAGMPGDVCSVPLRSAIRALEALTGESYDEDILDSVFSKFCIGK